MSERVSKELDDLCAPSHIPNPWLGSRYEWVKALSSSEVGQLGERLAQRLLGGRFAGRKQGFDITLLNGSRVEVKISRRSFSQGNVWSWKQIRRADDYDFLCLVAVEPSHARMFLLPNNEVPEAALANLHGRGGDGTLRQIAVPRDHLPDWILRHQVE